MRWLHWCSKKPSEAARAFLSDPPTRSFRILKLDEDTDPDVQEMLRQRAYKPEPKKPIAQWRFQSCQPVNIYQVEDLKTATCLHENVKTSRPGKIVHLQDGVSMPGNERRKPYWMGQPVQWLHPQR